MGLTVVWDVWTVNLWAINQFSSNKMLAQHWLTQFVLFQHKRLCSSWQISTGSLLFWEKPIQNWNTMTWWFLCCVTASTRNKHLVTVSEAHACTPNQSTQTEVVFVRQWTSLYLSVPVLSFIIWDIISFPVSHLLRVYPITFIQLHTSTVYMCVW